MKELLKQLGFEYLPMLSEFVERIHDREPDDDRFANLDLFYTRLITQPLTKGMFIPCGEDGNVIIAPKVKEMWLGKNVFDGDMFESTDSWKQYQQALDRVIFENKYPSFELNEITMYELYPTIEDAINAGVKLKLI